MSRRYLMLLILAGCAAQSASAYDNSPEPVVENGARYADPADPWEGMNRGVFAFNDGLDRMVVEPMARGYRAVTNEYARDRIGSAFSNLGEPVNFLNALLQGDIERSFAAFWRFVVNTTAGAGGLYDVAAQAGLKERDEDFGQTLAVYGAGSGPYLMLPVLGPSSVRDTAGKVVDAFTNPFNYLEGWTATGINAADAVDAREGLLETVDDIRRTSFDPYATVKSAYTQHRDDEIGNGH